MNTDILISVIVPVRNGDIWLDKLLSKLLQQTLIDQTEIIIIDSGSTDNSLEIIKRYPVRLIQIPSHEFNHGGTRNLGVQQAKGKYIVMTVQDATPASDLWLQHLIDGFVDEQVAGVCGQQIVPHELDKNPVLWFRPLSEPQKKFYRYDNPEEFLKLTPLEQREKIAWDNVTAAYRRDLLIKFPFPTIDFAEDIFWAKRMLLAGYTLAIIDEARVAHYHHHLPHFIPPRYFSVYYFEYKLFGKRPGTERSILIEVLVAGKILLKESSISWFQKFKWLMFNIRYWLVLRKTIKIFNRAVDKGDQFLDTQYQHICNKIPQAPKM